MKPSATSGSCSKPSATCVPIQASLPKWVSGSSSVSWSSYLSEKQLTYLFDGLKEALDWSGVEEVAFECEPGTLSTRKLECLKSLGVTRVSLGIENFNDQILELNNRAHRSQQVGNAYDWAKDAGFQQINIDLISRDARRDR